MDSRQWREKLHRDLHEQRLPPAYIDRLMEELSDHIIDSQMENTSMEAQQAFDRLGSPNNIAAAASHEFRRRTFAGRHPWLTFIFSPILLVPFIFVLSLLVMALVLSIVGMAVELVAGEVLSDNPVGTEVGFAIGQFCNALIRFVPFAIAVWIYCRLAKRCGRDRWAAFACGIIATLAGAMISKVTRANDGVHSGFWVFGFAYQPNMHQFLQMLVPLAIAAWLLFRLPTTLPQASAASKATAT